MEQQERSKMLGTMPMGRLVPKVSVPIMVSMLVQALYNIVDGIFVARYSPNALTAVSLAFPIQLLMIAVATGLGVGINSLISRKLRRAKRPAAACCWSCAASLCSCCSACWGRTVSSMYLRRTRNCSRWRATICAS